MCGLTLSISPISPPGHVADASVIKSLHAANAARGPNAHGVYARRVSVRGGDVLVTLASSVLGLRGENVTPQPLVGQRGALAWNGQVFSGLDVGVHENDTAKIFARLEAGDDPLAVLAAVEGPYVARLTGTHPRHARTGISLTLDGRLFTSALVVPRDNRCPVYCTSGA